tara:strand:+ start:86 stop:439 length:354 start_codon:yes stop_codon:yes gene_type:complete
MVAFTLNDAKIKVTERSRGRMKIQIKFSKEEAEGFKNFCKLKPPELGDETFYKQIFFAGCNAMTEQIKDLVAKHEQSKRDNPEEEQSEQDKEPQEATASVTDQDTPAPEKPNEQSEN